MPGRSKRSQRDWRSGSAQIQKKGYTTTKQLWSPKDLDLWELEREIARFQTGSGQGINKKHLSQRLPDLKSAVHRIQAWVDSYDAGLAGYAEFRELWKYARLGFALQNRLLVEQVLWDRGRPWSDLCTGFKQI